MNYEDDRVSKVRSAPTISNSPRGERGFRTSDIGGISTTATTIDNQFQGQDQLQGQEKRARRRLKSRSVTTTTRQGRQAKRQSAPATPRSKNSNYPENLNLATPRTPIHAREMEMQLPLGNPVTIKTEIIQDIKSARTIDEKYFTQILITLAPFLSYKTMDSFATTCKAAFYALLIDYQLKNGLEKQGDFKMCKHIFQKTFALKTHEMLILNQKRTFVEKGISNKAEKDIRNYFIKLILSSIKNKNIWCSADAAKMIANYNLSLTHEDIGGILTYLKVKLIEEIHTITHKNGIIWFPVFQAIEYELTSSKDKEKVNALVASILSKIGSLSARTANLALEALSVYLKSRKYDFDIKLDVSKKVFILSIIKNFIINNNKISEIRLATCTPIINHEILKCKEVISVLLMTVCENFKNLSMEGKVNLMNILSNYYNHNEYREEVDKAINLILERDENAYDILLNNLDEPINYGIASAYLTINDYNPASIDYIEKLLKIKIKKGIVPNKKEWTVDVLHELILTKHKDSKEIKELINDCYERMPEKTVRTIPLPKEIITGIMQEKREAAGITQEKNEEMAALAISKSEIGKKGYKKEYMEYIEGMLNCGKKEVYPALLALFEAYPILEGKKYQDRVSAKEKVHALLEKSVEKIPGHSPSLFFALYKNFSEEDHKIQIKKYTDLLIAKFDNIDEPKTSLRAFSKLLEELKKIENQGHREHFLSTAIHVVENSFKNDKEMKECLLNKLLDSIDKFNEDHTLAIFKILHNNGNNSTYVFCECMLLFNNKHLSLAILGDFTKFFKEYAATVSSLDIRLADLLESAKTKRSHFTTVIQDIQKSEEITRSAISKWGIEGLQDSDMVDALETLEKGDLSKVIDLDELESLMEKLQATSKSDLDFYKKISINLLGHIYHFRNGINITPKILLSIVKFLEPIDLLENRYINKLDYFLKQACLRILKTRILMSLVELDCHKQCIEYLKRRKDINGFLSLKQYDSIVTQKASQTIDTYLLSGSGEGIVHADMFDEGVQNTEEQKTPVSKEI